VEFDIRLNYMYSVISVKTDSLPANTQIWKSTRSWPTRDAFSHPWAGSFEIVDLWSNWTWIIDWWVGRGEGYENKNLTNHVNKFRSSPAYLPIESWYYSGYVFLERSGCHCGYTKDRVRGSDAAPTNKICRRASSEQRPRTRSCHEWERLV